MMEETRSRSSPPAGSRARKIWEPEEVTVLIRLRQENPKVSWVQMQNIFNANVPSSRHRTSDALACKYKTVKSIEVLPPSQPDSQVQNDLAGNVFLQQAPHHGITNDHLLHVDDGQYLTGLGIELPFEESHVGWTACWDGQVDTDGYLNDLWEADENAAAMRARATEAAVGGSLNDYSGVKTTTVRFPSELIGARGNGSG